MPNFSLLTVMMVVVIVGNTTLTVLTETALNYKLPGPFWKRMVHNLMWQMTGVLMIMAYLKYK